VSDQLFERRLAAIVVADVVGYSRMMGLDETGTLTRLKTLRQTLIEPMIARYHGRIVKLMGDGVLIEFPSVVDALACSVQIQRAIPLQSETFPEDQHIELRVGINLGDVIVEGDDLYGDGVNIAARLEPLAEPGGICVSQSARQALGSKLPLDYEDMGAQSLKNITEAVHAFRVNVRPDAVIPEGSSAGNKTAVDLEKHVSLSWRWVASAVIALLLGAGGAFFGWQSEIEPVDLEVTAHLQPNKPSIAVLPFINMSGDPEQEYFANGITEDLTTDLSQISGLFVVAHNSSFAYQDEPSDVRKVSRELGVKYVLEGSVRRSGDAIRINAQLIDATTGGHVWGERFDGTLADVFSLQDEVNIKIVTALEVNLTIGERERLGKAETSSPDAYDILLRGLELHQRFIRESNVQARDLFKQAIALDTNYARAYANVALTHAVDVNFNWSENREESIRLGLEYAAQALEIDDSIPQIYFTRSVLYLAQRHYDAAIEAARRTVQVHPNYADGSAVLAFVLSYAGQPEEALVTMNQAKRLNPQYSHIYLATEGRILFILRRYQEARVLLEESVQRNPMFDQTQLLLAAIYAELGELEDAAWAVDEALVIRADLSLADERREANYKRAEDLDQYISALRKAGVPEK
jgi:adenylate cyclase